jgi:large repetitive protein
LPIDTIRISRTYAASKLSSRLSLSPSPLTATVSPAALSPLAATGTVQFFDGGVAVGTPVAIANGVATYSSSGFTAGSHTLTAAYSGDGNYAGSTSTAAATLTVSAPGTTTVLTSSSNPSVFGQSITLTATVTAPGAGTPSGLVAFFDGATQLGTGNLSSGVATLATSALSKASHALKAVYAGTPSFATSTSTVLTQVVNLAGSTTTVTASSNPTVVGQPVTLSATVAPVSPSAGTPTGTVLFKDGAATLGSPGLAGGAASLATNALTVGGHPITAQYSGDAGFAASTGGPLTVNISQKSTATVLTADKTSPVLFGTTINLTAAVTPGTATGTVSFLDGSATLGSAPLAGGTASTPARATFATSTLGIGTHNLTARYVGDASDATSTSAPLTLVIKPPFTATGSLLQSRVSHTATLLNDGRVLVAGGSGAGDDDTRASRTAEIYCPDPYTPPATPVRTLAQWCPNGVGKFSVAGRGNTAQVGVGNLVQARTYHTATLLPDGTVLLVGGYDASGITTATAEIYDATDPIADKFTAVASLPGNAAAGHTATLITKSGKTYVLAVGGGSAKSWLYDVQAKTWSVSGTMTGVRSSHTASVVGTKVLVAGGTDVLGRTLQTTTIYDIATGSFASGPTMLSPRELHTASVIANGKVLLAGGRASTGVIANTVALTPLAEIYDPSNATTPFAAAAFASGTGRFGHSASALIAAANGQPDGRVFVAGGGVSVLCGQQLATSELYASGAFTSGGTMAAARVRHTATVLKDGRVLVAGGRGATGNNCGPLNTAEIWNAPPAP